jgi:hypothetical protein
MWGEYCKGDKPNQGTQEEADTKPTKFRTALRASIDTGKNRENQPKYYEFHTLSVLVG